MSDFGKPEADDVEAVAVGFDGWVGAEGGDLAELYGACRDEDVQVDSGGSLGDDVGQWRFARREIDDHLLRPIDFGVRQQ